MKPAVRDAADSLEDMLHPAKSPCSLILCQLCRVARNVWNSMKILIVAEHASARFGGEAALPLHYFRVLRKREIPVWLLSHARTRPELESLYPGDAAIYYIDDSPAHRWLWKIGKALPDRISDITTGYVSRILTQLAQRKIAFRLVKEQGITVIHQPMPVSPREPSLLFGFGVPVVIGPMNGGMTYPAGFSALEGKLERLFVAAGRACSDAMNLLLPGKRQAAALIVANPRTAMALPHGACKNVIELVENGVDMSIWEPRPPLPAKDDACTTFVYMGRLVGWKAVDLLIAAFERARQQAAMQLWVLGDGQLRQELQADAAARDLLASNDDHNLGKIRFFGWLTQADCAARLADSDCLVLPSLYECGGAVVLEAMAMSKPIIACKWGGPADYLDDRCGILVDPASREAVVDGFSTAMIELARAPQQRRQMGQEGLAKIIRLYDWEVKVDRILEIYAAAQDNQLPCREP